MADVVVLGWDATIWELEYVAINGGAEAPGFARLSRSGSRPRLEVPAMAKSCPGHRHPSSTAETKAVRLAIHEPQPDARQGCPVLIRGMVHQMAGRAVEAEQDISWSDASSDLSRWRLDV
jgi:hypothetical protein